MLRIYICPKCYNLRMVSRKPTAICFHCGNALEKCDVEYDTYINMNEEERRELKNRYKQRMEAYQDKLNHCYQEQEK